MQFWASCINAPFTAAYWIINLPDQQVEVFQKPAWGQYVSKSIHFPAETLVIEPFGLAWHFPSVNCLVKHNGSTLVNPIKISYLNPILKHLKNHLCLENPCTYIHFLCSSTSKGGPTFLPKERKGCFLFPGSVADERKPGASTCSPFLRRPN